MTDLTKSYTKEALKLALEALYEYVEQHGQTHLAKRAMPKLREALAQPEQEQVVLSCMREIETTFRS